MKRIILFPVTTALLLAAVIVLLLASNLYTYYRLTAEVPIAELRFVASGPREYQAMISTGDFCTPQHFTLHGDQWRVDARFLKWRPWANLFGFDALYRIERLGGRYRDIDEENTSHHRAYKLQPEDVIDLAGIFSKYQGPFSPVDTLYGSSVYEDMNESYLYTVYRGQSGLLIRKTDYSAAGAADGVMTIEINKSCAQGPGLFEQAARHAGKLARALAR